MDQARTKIQDILDGFQKYELEDFGILLGAELPARLRKSELVGRLSYYLSEQPLNWLNHLLEQDLRLLRQLVQAGAEARVRQDIPDYPSILEVSGLVETGERDDDYRDIWIRKEIHAIVAPHLEAALTEGERSGRFEIERVAMGYLNLYGVLPYDLFIDLMMRYYEQDFGTDFDQLLALLNQSPIIALCRYQSHSHTGEYLCSPQVVDVEELLERRKAYPVLTDYRPFSWQEAREAGSGSPLVSYGLSSPSGRSLVKMLRRMGYEGGELQREVHYIWLNAQYYEEELGSADELFMAVSSQADWFVSDEEYRRFLQIIARYANSLPRWVLNGYSCEESGLYPVEVEEDAALPPVAPGPWDQEVPGWTMPRPTISPGYTDTIEREGPFKELSPYLPEGFPFGMAIPHVAPSDPCPCGSGLQYRHCHGKRLS